MGSARSRRGAAAALILSALLALASPAAAVVPGTNGLLAIGVCGARGEGAPPAPGGICTLKADSTQQHKITTGSDSEPAWSPDGTALAFVRLDAQGNSHVQLAGADGSGVRQFTSGTNDRAPAWAPDGKRIAFSRGGAIAVVDVTSGAVTTLTAGPRDYDPAWSPDGGHIAFSSGTAPAQIDVINADGSDRRTLTTGVQPAWAPSGAQLAFTDTASDHASHIGVIAAGGGTVHDITTGATDDSYMPTWSPDATKLAIGRGEAMENPGVWVIDADGSHATRVAGGYDPDWQTARPATSGGCAPSVQLLNDAKAHATVVARAATGCFAQSGTTYTHTGPMTINGLDVSSDAALTLDARKHRITFGGPGTLSLGPIPLSKFPAGAMLTLTPSLTLATIPGSLFGFKFDGPLKLGFDDHEGTSVEGKVKLELLGDKIDGSVFLYTSNAGGLQFDGVRIHVSDAPVDPRVTAGRICNPKSTPFPSGWECVLDPRLKNGQGHWLMIGNAEAQLSWLPVEELEISYQRHGPHGTGEWTGRVVIQLSDLLPGAPEKVVPLPTVALAIDLVTNPFKLYQLSGQVSDLNIPVPFTEAVFLQDLGLGFGLDPFMLNGNVRVTMGPEVAGDPPLGIAGGFTYKRGGESGFDLKVTGALKAFKDLDLANGYADLDVRDGGAKVTLGGTIGKDFGPVHLDVGASGGLAFDSFRAQLGLNGTATIFGQGVSANGVLSNAGIGVCGRLDVFLFHGEIGFTHRWNDGTDFFTCDLSGLYTVAPPPSRAAADGRTLTLPRGLSHVELAAVGQTGPPALRLSGPGVEGVISPAVPDQIELHPGVLSLAESGARTTLFVLDHPAAGDWQIVPLPGAAPPVRYLRADPAVAPRVRARVTGHGLRRTLTWRYSPQRGRTVAFEEHGPFTARTITSHAAPRGHVRFRPGGGPPGARNVVAAIAQDGIARSSVVVAHYRAPAQPFVRRVRHARFHVHRGTLTVRWSAVRHASAYEVDVRLRRGSPLRLRSRAPRGIRVALPAGAIVRSARVRALRDGVPGAFARARG